MGSVDAADLLRPCHAVLTVSSEPEGWEGQGRGWAEGVPFLWLHPLVTVPAPCASHAAPSSQSLQCTSRPTGCTRHEKRGAPGHTPPPPPCPDSLSCGGRPAVALAPVPSGVESFPTRSTPLPYCCSRGTKYARLSSRREPPGVHRQAAHTAVDRRGNCVAPERPSPRGPAHAQRCTARQDCPAKPTPSSARSTTAPAAPPAPPLLLPCSPSPPLPEKAPPFEARLLAVTNMTRIGWARSNPCRQRPSRPCLAPARRGKSPCQWGWCAAFPAAAMRQRSSSRAAARGGGWGLRQRRAWP